MLRHSKFARTASLTTAMLAIGGMTLSASAQVAPADTGTGSVTAAVTSSLGGRSVTSVSDLTFANATSTTMTATSLVVIDETLADGVNGWYVTMGMNDLSDGASGTIGKANLSVGTSLETSGAGFVSSGTVTYGSSQDLSTDATLFTVAGESPGTLYTGLYPVTTPVTLTVPAGTTTGTYTGTVTITVFE